MSCPRVLLAVLLTLLHRARPFEIPSFYHKSSDVRSYFDGPVLTGSRVRLEHARDPLSEATLPTLVITDFSAQQNVWRDRPVILLVFGEHARELITTEVGLWLSHLLVYGDEQLSTWPAFRDALQEAQQHARLLGNGSPADWVGRLLSRLVFVVVLMENEAGRERVEGGNMCLRKAVSGVDLNRNWAFNWKPVKASSEEYGGPEPFSEAESRILRELGRRWKPLSYVNVHSGEWAIYTPWDSKPVAGEALPPDTDALVQKMNAFCGCIHGAAGAVSGYLAFGSSMDWMYTELQVPYPLTLEVYGPGGLGKSSSQAAEAGRGLLQQHSDRCVRVAPGAYAGEPGVDAGESLGAPMLETPRDPQRHLLQQHCFSLFNPGTASEYQTVVASWVAALMVLADHLATDSPLASSPAVLPGHDAASDTVRAGEVELRPGQVGAAVMEVHVPARDAASGQLPAWLDDGEVIRSWRGQPPVRAPRDGSATRAVALALAVMASLLLLTLADRRRRCLWLSQLPAANRLIQRTHLWMLRVLQYGKPPAAASPSANSV